jgi:AcrR family transcriptional regulator
MPRTAAQNERIRDATRSAIVDGAMRLFAQHGYAHTTTRQIAAEAGVSAGLMYHYFESKEQLLHAVFDNCMAILDAAFTRAYEYSAPGEGLAAILRTIFTMLEADPEFWGLFYMMRTQPAIMSILGDSFRLRTGRLRALFVAELRQAGRASPEMDALLLYSLVEGTIQQYLLDPEAYPLAAVADRIIAQAGASADTAPSPGARSLT